jgi:Ty3 transposon capsid-like protein/Zinc knuckle
MAAHAPALIMADPIDAVIPAELRDKLKIPAPSRYDGKRDPDVIRSWLQEMDNYATFHGLTNGQRLAIVPFYLTGPAARWWVEAKDDMPLGWGGVEDAFKKTFLPKNHIQRLRNQLSQLKQTGSVAAYSSLFRQLILSLPKFDPDWVLHMYIQGLKDMTRLEVEQKEPATLADAEAIALRVDDIRFAPKANKPTTPGQRNGNRTNLTSIDTPRLAKLTDAERQRLRASGSCFKCRQRGHLAKDCTVRFSTPVNPPAPQNPHQPARRNLPAVAIDVATETNGQPENGQRR